MTSPRITSLDDVRALTERHRDLDDRDPAPVVPLRPLTATETHEVDDTTPEPVDLDSEAVGQFWQARPVLAHILEFARSRRAGPWAVLGITLARVVAATEPNVMIPPIIGGPVSTNLFVALVGPSGGGKGAAEGAARDAVTFVDYNEKPIGTESFTLGSGEGLSRTFAPWRTDDGEYDRRTRAMFSVSEVDTLTALGSRTGATLLPELRKLYSGESIGFQNANRETRAVIDAHAYRACLTIGVQPAKAGPLVNDADGGTPQRFLWMPVSDPGAPDRKPSVPEPWVVKSPRWGAEDTHVGVPEQARAEIDGHRLAVLRGEPVDPLDGHRMLSRLKVATALAMLDGRSIVDSDDWELSGVVMAKSDHTRALIERTLAEQTRRSNRARAEMDGERAAITDDVRAAADLKRATDGIVRYLTRKGTVTAAELRRALRVNLRDYFAEAVASLVDAGAVREINTDGRDRYTLT